MSFELASQAPDAVSLTKNQILTANLWKLAEDPLNWHKIEIQDVFGLNRNTVLKCIAEHTKPLDLIPIAYTQQMKGACFYIRNSSELIQALCHKHILIPNENKKLVIKIILKYCTTNEVQIDLYSNVKTVLQKRLKNEDLNLNYFLDDEDLSEFWLLAQPRQLAFVLYSAQRVCKPLKKLCLANNKIQSLDGLNVLSSASLTSLDIRNNAINDLCELRHLSGLHLTELFLEGNPVCKLFNDQSYLQYILQYCPYIEKIDGFLIRQNGFPSFRRNFLCNISSKIAIDQLLADYFDAYEARNFDKLREFYHECCHYTLTTSQLRVATYSFIQRDAIVYFLSKLPWWEHDQYSFTVDVIMYSKERCIFVITGVFRQLPNISNILSFNRCFTVVFKNDTFQITNEQVLIYETSKSVSETAFKKCEYVKIPPTDEKKMTLIKIFACITNLNQAYSEMFLEQCFFNMKHALVLFTDLYENDRIPDEEFSSLTFK